MANEENKIVNTNDATFASLAGLFFASILWAIWKAMDSVMPLQIQGNDVVVALAQRHPFVLVWITAFSLTTLFVYWILVRHTLFKCKGILIAAWESTSKVSQEKMTVENDLEKLKILLIDSKSKYEEKSQLDKTAYEAKLKIESTEVNRLNELVKERNDQIDKLKVALSKTKKQLEDMGPVATLIPEENNP